MQKRTQRSWLAEHASAGLPAARQTSQRRRRDASTTWCGLRRGYCRYCAADGLQMVATASGRQQINGRFEYSGRKIEGGESHKIWRASERGKNLNLPAHELQSVSNCNSHSLSASRARHQWRTRSRTNLVMICPRSPVRARSAFLAADPCRSHRLY